MAFVALATALTLAVPPVPLLVPLQLDISPAEQNALAEANAKAEATAADPARAVDTHGLATERAAWEAHANATFPGRDLPGRELDCAEEYASHAMTRTLRMEWAEQHLGGANKLHGIEVGACGMPLRLPPNVDVTYVDQDLGKASTQCETGDSRQQVTDDATTLRKFDNASLDFVVGMHVLEHTTNFLGAVEQWVRVTKPGGLILIGLPDACDPEWNTGESLRLAAEPEHYVADYKRHEEGYHLAEGAVYLHGIDKPRAAQWNAKLSANGLKLSDVPAGVTDGENIRSVLAKDGKTPLVMHQHVWTKDTLRRTLEAATPTLFAPTNQFEIVSIEVADAKMGDHMREFRAVLRKSE